jgi:hypothetical protein
MRKELERRIVNHPDAAVLREQIRFCHHFLSVAEFIEYGQLLLERLDLERRIADNNSRLEDLEFQINVIRHRARMYERDAEIDESLRFHN